MHLQKDKPRPWSVEPLAANTVKITFSDIRAGWEQEVLLSGDRHHDNKHTDQDLERKHLALAVQKQAPIIDVGDLHCAMQGKYDPRKSLDQLRPEYAGPDYLDRLVARAADFYEPYAHLWAVMGMGNHEVAQLDRHGVNLTAATVKEIRRRKPDSPLTAGGYGGWIWFQFVIRGTVKQSLRLKYYHGTDRSGAAVNRGVTDIQKMGTYLPDADIVHLGHNHTAWVVPVKRERLTQSGRVEQDVVWWVRTPGYKDEYRDGAGGWSVVMGHPPKPLGCVFLKFWLEEDRIRVVPTPLIT